MKNLILALLMATVTLPALAQSVNVTNTTNCFYTIEFYARDGSCTNDCITSMICIPPGASVIINSCVAGYDLETAKVYPADKNCRPCDSYRKVDNAGSPCIGLAHSFDGPNKHCGGCPDFYLDWNNPSILIIHN